MTGVLLTIETSSVFAQLVIIIEAKLKDLSIKSIVVILDLVLASSIELSMKPWKNSLK